MKKITEIGMKRFIRKHLPDCGTFGTADLFREKYDINPHIVFLPGAKTYETNDYRINEEFCDLLEKVAELSEDPIYGGYDPNRIKKAFRQIGKEEASD